MPTRNEKHVIRGYKRHACTKGVSYALTDRQALNIMRKPCHYCGVGCSNFMRLSGPQQGFLYTGIDRRNNDVGYLPRNCVPCCSLCNRAKSTRAEKEFIAWARRLGVHQLTGAAQ